MIIEGSIEKLTPYFLESTPGENRTMIFCVATNIALILFCLAHQIADYSTVQPGWWLLVIAMLAGYYLADIVSGIAHWSTDTWFTEQELGRLVAIAREHHTHPHHILGYRFREHATLGSIYSAIIVWPPAIAVALIGPSEAAYAVMTAFLVISTTLVFGTTFHNFGHMRDRPPIVRLAQKMRLMITPAHHSIHHRGDQTIRYCTVNGWANPLLDRIGFWRGFEWLITRLTGAVPRENDIVWQSHYRETGTMRELPRVQAAGGAAE